MIGFPALSADLTKSFVSRWTQYAGKAADRRAHRDPRQRRHLRAR